MMGSEGPFLEEVGAVPKAETLRKKEVQLNTRINYTQRRCLSLDMSHPTADLLSRWTLLACSGSLTDGLCLRSGLLLQQWPHYLLFPKLLLYACWVPMWMFKSQRGTGITDRTKPKVLPVQVQPAAGGERGLCQAGDRAVPDWAR